MPANCEMCNGSGVREWISDSGLVDGPCMFCEGGGIVCTNEELRAQMDALSLPNTYADIVPGTDLSDKIRQIKLIP